MSSELDEIWALYADDGALSLDAMEGALARLASAPDDGEAIASLFRAMHTFKGNSRILGLGAIEEVAHVAEDLIGLVRDDGAAFDRELPDLMIEAVDVLRHMLEQSVANKSDADPARSADLLVRMRAAQASRQAELRGEAPKPAASDDAGCDGEEPAAEEIFEDAMIFDAASTTSFADDPLYREIFFDLVRPALTAISAQVAPFDDAAREVITNELTAIADAAQRIGMPLWPDLVAGALAAVDAPADFAQAIAQMQQALPDAAPLSEVTSPIEGSVPTDVLAALQMLLADDPNGTSAADRDAALHTIKGWATAAGWPGLIDACADMRTAAQGRDAPRALYVLAEGIARSDSAEPSPAAQYLEAWCGVRVNATLALLADLLADQEAIDWPAILDQLQMFSAACRHFGWTTSLEVTHGLVDICARVRDGDLAADPILTRLLAAYTEGARAMAQANAEPRPIDLKALEKILEDAASAAGSLCSAGSGDIPELHGLPDGLRNSLSSESVVAIREAMADGRTLHVVRADVAEDTALAERFAAWLAATGTNSLACATVFENDRTTFDFLVATRQLAADVDAAFAEIDEARARLYRRMTLGPDVAQTAASAEPETVDAAVATGLQEAIGELAVARSCVRQTLGDYIEADLPSVVDQILAAAGNDPAEARAAVAKLMEGWQDKLRQLMQVEIQASTEFARLEDLARQMKPSNQATSVVDGMVVRACGHSYVLPIEAIERIITLDETRVVAVSAASGQSVVRLDNDDVVPLITLERGEGRVPVARDATQADSLLVMVARTPQGAVALCIDELVGQQSVFSKPLNGYLEGLQSVSGYAVLNSGDVGMLLDVTRLQQAA